MAARRLTGQAAKDQATKWIADWQGAINTALTPFEPGSTFDVWFSTLRGIEELINLPGELKDHVLLDRILRLNLLDLARFGEAIPDINAGLRAQFVPSLTARLLRTLVQVQAIAVSFQMHGIPAHRQLATVGSALDYLQSRRRHLLAFLHTIPGACRGTRKLNELDGLNQFMYLIESAGLGTTSMHQNVMLAAVYPDFELCVDDVGALANHSYNALDQTFLEPERTGITEMEGVDMSSVKLAPVSGSVIFSANELANNLKLITAAYAEFLLEHTSFALVAEFIQSLLPSVVDDYVVRLSAQRFDELCAASSLPDHLKKSLVATDSDYVNNTSTYAPFTRVGSSLITSVTLLSRFAYHWKNVCLNRVRRYQIRSGFIFEGSVKTALRQQGFSVTDIKRIGHAEFDVVATLDGVIYNLQCKNNLVDLNRIESDVGRFVRYNQSLDKAYARALEKERAREDVLLTELGLPTIKHFLISRFPVATQNSRVLAFGEIRRFRSISVNS